MSQSALSHSQFRGLAISDARSKVEAARQNRERSQLWNGGAALEHLEYRGPLNSAHQSLNDAASARKAAQWAG